MRAAAAAPLRGLWRLSWGCLGGGRTLGRAGFIINKIECCSALGSHLRPVLDSPDAILPESSVGLSVGSVFSRARFPKTPPWPYIKKRRGGFRPKSKTIKKPRRADHKTKKPRLLLPHTVSCGAGARSTHSQSLPYAPSWSRVLGGVFVHLLVDAEVDLADRAPAPRPRRCYGALAAGGTCHAAAF